mgnify:CR=1 FL=1
MTEMKWMHGDFEKERRAKRKLGLNLTKQIKKYLNSKQTEEIKNIKRQEQNLQKRYVNLSRAVKTYWQKIDKITKVRRLNVLNNRKERKAFSYSITENNNNNELTAISCEKKPYYRKLIRQNTNEK